MTPLEKARVAAARKRPGGGKPLTDRELFEAANRRQSRTRATPTTAAVKKATESNMAPVYDANGKLIGLVDPKKITAVKQPAADDATVVKASKRFPEIAAPLSNLPARVTGPSQLRKSKADIPAAFEDLCKSIGTLRANNLRMAVSTAALNVQLGANKSPITTGQAVRFAKATALEIAAEKRLI